MASEPEFIEESIVRLVSDLRATFRSGKTKDLRWREQQLDAIHRFVTENEQRITRALREDLGRPETESFVTELSSVASNALSAKRNFRNWAKPTNVSTNLANFPGQSFIESRPLGVILIISPWNFPLSMVMDPLIGAIAAGNAAVIKPSEIASATSALLAELLPKYLDVEAVRVVEGGIPETSTLLLQKWDKIFFTGNKDVGRIVATAAAKHLTPVVLELGGKCPSIVDTTVDLKSTAERLIFGGLINGGQACLACDYVLVQEEIAGQLVDALKKTLIAFYGTNQESPISDLCRIVNLRHFKRVTGLLDDPRVKEKIVFGGHTIESERYISPTIVWNAPWNSDILQEEIFGPVLVVQNVKDIDEAIAIVRDRPKPLAIYPFSKDRNVVKHILDSVDSGGACVNDAMVHFGNDALPFGGVGESGYGSYHGKFSFDTFSHRRGVVHKSFGGDIDARFPPYTLKKTSVLRALLTGKLLYFLLLLLGIAKGERVGENSGKQE